jgi:uncharacterized membrane protein
VLLPWIGVMMAGYGFGLILVSDPARRRKICLFFSVPFAEKVRGWFAGYKSAHPEKKLLKYL